MDEQKCLDSPNVEGEVVSEKAQKKAAAKAEKEAKKAAKEAEKLEQSQAAAALLNTVVKDVDVETFGFLPLNQSTYRSERKWTRVEDLNSACENQMVWIRARLQDNRCKGSIGFVVLREKVATVQGVISSDKSMIKWVGSLPVESVVNVYGKVTVPQAEILGASQPVEIQVEKMHCVSKVRGDMPFLLKDGNRPERDQDKAEEGAVRVAQDTRLDGRVIDLRTTAMQAIMRISSTTCALFREALAGKGFIEIHTPKLIGGSSEGGSNVFSLKYFGRDACLAQSPQLYKQMAISGDLDRVFEIGPVFRAENSNTHRHLCEFTGLDLEMSFHEHYFEVVEVLEELFKYMFKGLAERCALEVAAVHNQFPAEPFVFNEKVFSFKFSEGCQMLRDAGYPIPEDISEFDISTDHEKALGKLIKEKHNTDFYYMLNYPTKVRAFYSMPCADDPTFSNSYDFFMRGEEILSGAQRIHEPNLLTERAKACGIDVSTIKDYIEAFSYGAYPHGGCGVGLERVVMLYLGLGNIRKVSMFPRDPKRISP